jgi:hypothetical protein
MTVNGATRPPALSTRPATPALALSTEQAAAALSVSWDVFHEQIEPELRIIRLGRRKLIPVAELERWISDHAERVLP